MSSLWEALWVQADYVGAHDGAHGTSVQVQLLRQDVQAKGHAGGTRGGAYRRETLRMHPLQEELLMERRAQPAQEAGTQDSRISGKAVTKGEGERSDCVPPRKYSKARHCRRCEAHIINFYHIGLT